MPAEVKDLAMQAISGAALYYPYIELSDVSWLKANLLLFGQVRRMIPFGLLPNDLGEVKTIASAKRTDGERLVRGARIWAPRARQAQARLAKRLLDDVREVEDFKTAHGCAATRAGRPKEFRGFQIHTGKFAQELKEALRRAELAWDPVSLDPYDGVFEYVEVHPKIGEAIMSTLAIACADAEGLTVVGDARSGELHRVLIERDSDGVYDACLHPESRPPDAPTKVSGERLFRACLRLRCDLSNLTSDDLVRLIDEQEPLRALVTRLGDQAARLSAKDEGPERNREIGDALDGALREWRKNRKNLSPFLRKFFGIGVSDVVADAATDAGALAVSTWGGFTAFEMAGAGVGLTIGVANRAVRTLADVRNTRLRSPWRYLTLLDESGVRFDFGARESGKHRGPNAAQPDPSRVSE